MSLDIEKYLEEQLLNIDLEGLINAKISQLISDDIKRNINALTNNKIEKIIDLEIEIALSHKIQIDDGWGEKREYASLADLFKETFYKKMNSDWDMKKKIIEAVKTIVDKLFNEYGKELRQRFADELLKLDKNQEEK